MSFSRPLADSCSNSLTVFFFYFFFAFSPTLFRYTLGPSLLFPPRLPGLSVSSRPAKDKTCRVGFDSLRLVSLHSTALLSRSVTLIMVVGAPGRHFVLQRSKMDIVAITTNYYHHHHYHYYCFVLLRTFPLLKTVKISFEIVNSIQYIYKFFFFCLRSFFSVYLCTYMYIFLHSMFLSLSFILDLGIRDFLWRLKVILNLSTFVQLTSTSHTHIIT